MKAAIVAQAGSTPVYGDFKEPSPSSGENSIAVTATALSPVVKARVSGAHYSAPGDFPFVAGIDGVGRLHDGSRVYFILPKAPYGSMAERAVVPSSQCVRVPDGVDDIAAAAIANPGLSSWAALKERARLATGETVLVNGATGTSGRLAVQIAKHLGAGKVIATGRNAAALQSLRAIGADETILLGEVTDALDAAFKAHFTAGVDVVLVISGAKAPNVC
jgi:NADPH:quinone reductase-like Zn-dependent oxidoreductase